ncbi:MAG: LysR substrate-binding domain-containing protein [Magnetovibrionaceae bacterium]
MNLRDLRYAVAVADLGHFGRAAEACHIGQPTLSAQIKKLEESLGITLFERTKRSVRITPDGEAVLAEARLLLASAERIQDIARARTDPLRGELSLGLIPTIGPFLTPILLPSLRHNLPDLALSLTERTTSRLEADLLAGTLDAAILATEPTDPKLTSIPLFTEPFRVALPRGHRLEAQDEIRLADLADDTLLLLEEGHCMSDQIQGFCAHALEVGASDRKVHPARVSTRHTSLMTVLALVGAGRGVTLVPALSLQGSWLTDTGIIIRKEANGEAARLVRLVFRSAYPRRALLEKLADILAAIVPDTVQPERR